MYGFTDATSYDNWVGHVVEGLARPGYNLYAPWDVQTNGFGNYIHANAAQREDWRTIINLFLTEDFDAAQAAIDWFNFPYEIVQFHDTDKNRTYYMLREFLNMDYFDDNNEPNQPQIHQHGSFDYGWGIYIYDPLSEVPVIINVVHPKDDFIALPVAVHAFQKWNARYLMVAGAGREVMWHDNYPIYHNNLSISDPSRSTNHVFNVAFKEFADEIRMNFNRRELSVQIHSFDYSHMGRKCLQISATSHQYPQLPIRDLSGNFLDIVNASPYLIIPANTIGIHSDVLVTDYYSVYYDQHGMFYQHGDELLPISNAVNLPGVGGFPMSYPMSNWSQYDVFTPFFHIEMEELPSIYPQDEYHYKWFYDYDHIMGNWHPENFYTKAIAFYTRWLVAMDQVLPPLFEFNDLEPPTDPINLRVVGSGNTTVDLVWDRSYAYDFKTYELLVATEPFDSNEDDYLLYDRSVIPFFGTQAADQITISGLIPETQYYFKIRAKDYNNNYSLFSNSTARYTGMVSIADFAAYGRDNYIGVSWLARFQYDNLGFNIFRREEEENVFTLISSWETDRSLVGTENQNVIYNYQDSAVVNGNKYYYILTTNDTETNEYYHDVIAEAASSPIYSLIINNQNGTIYDTVEFGCNLFATDNYDANFDIVKGSHPNEAYIWAMSYKSSWPSSFRNLHRDIYSPFDPDNELKNWVIRVATDQLLEPLDISISTNFQRNSEKLYLFDQLEGVFHDLTASSFTYEAETVGFRYFTLYWGDLLPEVVFTPFDYHFLQANDFVVYSWIINREFLVDTIDLYIKTENDSLLIASNLPSDTTTYSWYVPDDHLLENAQLVVRTIVIDGYPLEHYSPYMFGLVPAYIPFANQAGWHMTANFLELPYIFGTDVFGNQSQLFAYNSIEEEYDDVLLYQFGLGHFVYMPVHYNTEKRGRIRQQTYDIVLVQGWNLIPNVFLSDIKVSDLLFVTQDNQYTFRQAMQYNIVNRGVIGIRDSGYYLSDYLYSGESVWIWVNSTDLLLRLRPFHITNDYLDFPVSWQSEIEVSRYDGVRDQILIGSALFTDENYNYLYDLPKPPARPNSDVYLYLLPDQQSHPFQKLHSEFKSDLYQVGLDSLLWNFVLEWSSELQPVVFNLSNSSLPTEYRIVLMIEDFFVVLTDELEFVFQPTSDLIIGKILVTNKDVSSVEELPELPVLFSNYPNPFNISSSTDKSIGTNISFYIDRSDDVKLEIFNIKGQRIIILLDEKRNAGKHTVCWDGRDNRNRQLASGVYLYRLSVGNRMSAVKKMMLLK
ncbi:MAG: T9SS type A sorting domain-containing protein [Candidatus Cloacimonetes bacterium]|nr:T9SS type A sorting domain-containing protein [Candidatus Cloacimonadota bacterium]